MNKLMTLLFLLLSFQLLAEVDCEKILKNGSEEKYRPNQKQTVELLKKWGHNEVPKFEGKEISSELEFDSATGEKINLYKESFKRKVYLSYFPGSGIKINKEKMSVWKSTPGLYGCTAHLCEKLNFATKENKLPTNVFSMSAQSAEELGKRIDQFSIGDKKSKNKVKKMLLSDKGLNFAKSIGIPLIDTTKSNLADRIVGLRVNLEITQGKITSADFLPYPPEKKIQAILSEALK